MDNSNSMARSCRSSFIDWLTFTWHPAVGSETVIRTSGPLGVLRDFYKVFPEFCFDSDDVVEFHGRSHYSFGLIFHDFITIFYDTMELYNKGVCVQVSSQGLSSLCSLFKSESVKDVLNILLLRGANVSRIDLAHDDYSRTFRPFFYEWMRIHKKNEDGSDCSGLLSSSAIKNYGYISNGSSGQGETFYAGSLKKRSKILRIYDKSAESDGEINAIRYEFELHGKHARDIVRSIVSGLFSFKDLFFENLRVLDIDSHDTINRSQIPLLPEWEEWFNSEFCEESDVVLHWPERRAVSSVAQRVRYVLSSWPMRLLKLAADSFGADNVMSLIQRAVLGEKFKESEIMQFRQDIQGFEREFLLACEAEGMKKDIF